MHQALDEAMGHEAAGILMDLLPPMGWSDVASRADVEAQGIALRGEIAELRGEVAELRAEMRGQVPRLILANIASMISIGGLVLAAGAVL